jgi:hypothetical protein
MIYDETISFPPVVPTTNLLIPSLPEVPPLQLSIQRFILSLQFKQFGTLFGRSLRYRQSKQPEARYYKKPKPNGQTCSSVAEHTNNQELNQMQTDQYY